MLITPAFDMLVLLFFKEVFRLKDLLISWQSEDEMFMGSLICNIDADCERLLVCKMDSDCVRTLHFNTEVIIGFSLVIIL